MSDDGNQTSVAGLCVLWRFTSVGGPVGGPVTYVKRDSVISNPDGTIVAETRGAEIPMDWSQLATDIVVSKYFRRAGLFGDDARGETSVRDVVTRIARTLREAGFAGGYFADASAADAFESDLMFMLINQYGAFNSPVWFNLGLFQRYGITGSGGNWAWREADGTVQETRNAYEAPQCSACFIQGAQDDLMAIFELVKNEARLFKYGSGTGSNFSALRGRQERLSGGGISSGLMSFLEVFDRAAGSTKSGGTTRRAAKMVCLDMDHPEIVDFIEWKMKEEKKAQALIASGYPADFNGEAYHTISGQNSNNSVRVTDEFMRAVEEDGEWQTKARLTGKPIDTYRAKDLWRKLALSAWSCADPGVQYDSTINDWHTCKVTGRINASNPCSEFMFLDDTSCNLASLNLTKFLVERGDGSLRFDVDAYRHAARVFFIAQEILVDFSSYPTKSIAQNSHDYRPLGLGYANLGTLLMLMGLGYDSDAGRAVGASLTAILTGRAYATSAELAEVKGPFPGYERNRDSMLDVMRKHSDAVRSIDERMLPTELVGAAQADWSEAIDRGIRCGYRNAQATVLAPTGTIGLLMDCDTTGIEPDFALVKFKKLAGGGTLKIVNASVERALGRLGYSKRQVDEILVYLSGTNTFLGAPTVHRDYLRAKGFTDADVGRVEAGLVAAYTIEQALSPFSLGADLLRRLGLEEEAKAPGFSLLKLWGLSREQIDALGDHVLGRGTVEGAPHLRDEHLPVFDCANRCGRHGKRMLSPVAHMKMMAAAQPFISGAISKTVNLASDATIDEVADVYYQGWKLGLKAVALYRDGCKASQPLNNGGSASAAAGGSAAASALAVIVERTEPSAVGQFLSSPAEAFSSINRAVREALGQPQRDPEEYVRAVEAVRSRRPIESGFAVRRRLPYKRVGFTQEAVVGGHKIFVRTGEYADGQLGEIFIDMHKEGGSFRTLLNAFAISVSMGLQHGIAPSEFVEQFTFTRFEPQGAVQGDDSIRWATSVVDYVARVVGIAYCKRFDLAHVTPTAGDATADSTDVPLIAPPPLAPAQAAGRTDGLTDGEACWNCGGTSFRRTGRCLTCVQCSSSNSGCS